ncbi:MAG: DinB family protein [Owenweeksia sp.]
MISRITYLRELRHELLHYKGDALKEFYYLESEDLRYKNEPGKWSIIEIFEHLNLTNQFYIQALSKALGKAEQAETDNFSHGWLGKKAIKMMRPNSEGNILKIPTLGKIDPRKYQKQGRVLVNQVVFQDFIDGLESLITLAEEMEPKAIDKKSIRTLVPFIRLSMGDALAFITAHTHRHIEQARQLANELQH